MLGPEDPKRHGSVTTKIHKNGSSSPQSVSVSLIHTHPLPFRVLIHFRFRKLWLENPGRGKSYPRAESQGGYHPCSKLLPQRLYKKNRDKLEEVLTAAARKHPKTMDRSTRMAVLAPIVAKHAPSLNPPAHPESDWFHPLASRIHALWIRVRDKVTPVRSTPSLRYFTATVVHELGRPRGMVVGTTPVLSPDTG